MAWFSFSSLFRKNKSEPAPGDSEFYSHAEDIPRTKRGSRRDKDDAVDPELPEKKRARRRLIGAVALTLGLVIVLPMVLDSEPKPASDDVVIRIPSRDKKAAVATPSAASVASAATANAVAEKPVDKPADKTDKPAESPAKPASVTAAPAVAAVAPAAAKPAPATAKPAPAAAPAAALKPQPTANAAKPATEATKLKQKELDAKPAVKPSVEAAKNPPKAEGKIQIQVAALATKQKVDELQSRLKEAGIKSHTQKVATAGGERIRVRIGPYATKAEADQACAKLSKMRLNCTILPN
ncbi:MAG: sporulation related domain protein [Burkholderiaceae bacterium]|nr:sporulation related domain protein [Burkholderiaceae bacterium]